MYQASTGTFLAAGVLATQTGWTFTGWGLIAAATLVAGALTIKCLHRRKGL